MSEAHLERKLGVVSATALVVSNMIGVGIFATTGFLAGDLGSPQLVVGIWLVGAAIALLGALCYSELGINFPRSGGEYVYLSEAWGPTWGFIDGWVSFFAGFSAPIAATALVISAYLAHFYPSLESGHPGATVIELGFVTIQLGGAQLAACGIVIAFTLLNLLGVSQVAALQNVLTATKLLVIAAFVVLGFTVGTGDWGHFTQSIEPTSSHGLGVQFAISLVFVYLGYSGWNAAVYVAEEIRNPGRTLPIALILGTFLVAILYVVLNCLYVFAVPLEDLKGVVAVGSAASASPFRPSRLRVIQRRHGSFAAGHGQCHVHDRSARLLRDGEEPRFLCHRREGTSAMEKSLAGGYLPGHLLLPADSDGDIPRFARLRGVHAEPIFGPFGIGIIKVPRTSRVEATALGQLRLSPASESVHCGQFMDISPLRDQ